MIQKNGAARKFFDPSYFVTALRPEFKFPAKIKMAFSQMLAKVVTK